MKITDIRLRKVNSENRMKAVASITFDEEFVVHDIKVIESEKGLFIAMPSRKTPSGEFKDIAHPINPETREKIQEAILEKYNAPDEETTADFLYEAGAPRGSNRLLMLSTCVHSHNNDDRLLVLAVQC